jgi:GT2 family glycosyltransferase
VSVDGVLTARDANSPARAPALPAYADAAVPPPTVTIVFLVYNRCEELRTSLRAMLEESDYPAELVDVIVVDNASEDGAAEMVERDFPQVGLIRRAVEAAGRESADLVSFGVRSSDAPDHRFDHRYRTGLLTFWGCAALIRRDALAELGGYDPEIFVWANELEFTLRLFDGGHRHLHLPEVVAVHMKAVSSDPRNYLTHPSYRINARHFAYIAAKLFAPRDAIEALVALLAQAVRDAMREDRVTLKAMGDVLKGFARGMRTRQPLRNREISRVYRHNFFSYASPWWMSRPVGDIVRSSLRRGPGERPHGRRHDYFRQRARYYPSSTATLRF